MPEVLATALADGETALDNGNQLLALERFDLALLIDGQNQRATKGRLRAMRLDQVLALVEKASAAEISSDWKKALDAYESALELDPEWSAARDGRDRVAAGLFPAIFTRYPCRRVTLRLRVRNTPLHRRHLQRRCARGRAIVMRRPDWRRSPRSSVWQLFLNSAKRQSSCKLRRTGLTL